MKILLLGNIDKSAVNNLKNNGFDIVYSIDHIYDTDVIGARSKTIVNKELLDKALNLKAICCFCSGTNNIDIKEATKRGIPVFNSPFQNTRSVAELVIAQIINLSRHLGDFNNDLHNNFWNKYDTKCFEVRNKVLGIIGYGVIGIQVGILAESIGMKVITYDVCNIHPIGNVTRVNTLAELLETSDFITIHVPLLPSTKNLININNIKQTKKGCYIINNSRGGIVDHQALCIGLESGQIGGVAIDVYCDEPKDNKIEYQNMFSKYKNVFMTPHIGGSTEEAQKNIGNEVSHKLIEFINNGITKSSVNL
jgi:D-3-phosphoglycerate dehydrogenase / 2-oxoglutarate reductase